MPSKERFGSIRSSGFGFTSAGESTIQNFIRKMWHGDDVSESEKDEKHKQNKSENVVVKSFKLMGLIP